MTAFASLVDYDRWFPGTLNGASDNARATAALAAACADIRLYCAQTFDLAESDVIEVHGTGTATLLLPQLPIVAINAVTIDKGLTSELTVTDFKVDLESGVLYRTAADACWPASWPLGVLNITVDYDHGFAVIPENLIRVACRLAHEDIVNPGAKLRAETIAGYSYQKDTGEACVDDYADILDRYKAQKVPVA